MSVNDPRQERVEIPGAIVERFHEPSNRDEVAEIVSAAAREGTGLLIAGGRTRLHWANAARDIAQGLSLRRLAGIDEFEPEEGVLHAAAGTPIRALRSAAAAEGWELPLDPPGARSTVGGTISSAAMGPRSQTLGRVADAILGLDVVGGDGVVSKCGGRVVKNVTGYDLAKLYCGSFGSLAVITGAWLRLRPMPAVSAVLAARVSTGREAFERCRDLGRLASVRALVWNASPIASAATADATVGHAGHAGHADLVVELGGSEAGVRHDRERIESVLSVRDASHDRIDELRDARAVQGEDPVALRVRVLGTACCEMVEFVRGLGLSVSVDLGLGILHARGRLDDPRQLLAIRSRALEWGGLATFEILPDAWRSELDVFGDLAGTASLTSDLKRRFDPAGVLNPGRFVAGT